MQVRKYRALYNFEDIIGCSIQDHVVMQLTVFGRCPGMLGSQQDIIAAVTSNVLNARTLQRLELAMSWNFSMEDHFNIPRMKSGWISSATQMINGALRALALADAEVTLTPKVKAAVVELLDEAVADEEQEQLVISARESEQQVAVAEVAKGKEALQLVSEELQQVIAPLMSEQEEQLQDEEPTLQSSSRQCSSMALNKQVRGCLA